ncbi:MAG: hypothetical protein ACP5IB_05770 [Thermoplasmata archaeon]
MIDAYFRNGKLFLAKLEHNRQQNALINFKEFLDNFDYENFNIDDSYIENNFREPVKEFAGSANVSNNATEFDLLRILKNFFEISKKSKEILKSSFKDTHKGTCTYCNQESEVFSNRSYVFPFERKIDSILPEENRMHFCKKCGFTLYSAMGYLYTKNNLLFFFDSLNLYNIEKMSIPIKKELRDPSNYNKIKGNLVFPTYYPNETIFVIMFEFAKYLERNNLISDYKTFLNDVRMYITAESGKGQIYKFYHIEGNILERIIEFYIKLILEGKVLNRTENKKITTSYEDLLFKGFFGNLIVNKGKPDENNRLREKFITELLNLKIDFLTLNEIFMERKRLNEKVIVPYYYQKVISIFMEVNRMDKEMFEKINGLGYRLGTEMKVNNLENYIWDIFRARGSEQFYNALVELQGKLKVYIDLRPINESEKNWREAKSILLNGILNAIYGGK